MDPFDSCCAYTHFAQRNYITNVQASAEERECVPGPVIFFLLMILQWVGTGYDKLLL